MAEGKYRIGLVVDYISSEYVQKLYNGVLSYCQKNHMTVLVFPIGQLCNKEFSTDYQYLSVAAHLTAANIDGLIFASGAELEKASTDYLTSYINSFRPLPVVSVGAVLPGIPSLISDCCMGFGNLISHLIEKHHFKRIALMGVTGNSEEGAERTEIYRRTLKDHDIPVDDSLLLYGLFTYQSALQALTIYEKQHECIDFDAIVALNDDMAYACIDFLKQRNIRIPEDIAVTGYDDLERSLYINPSLSTINQNIEGQGYAAADIIFHSLKKDSVPVCTRVPSRPVYRRSCGCSCISTDGRKQTEYNATEWCQKRQQFIKVVQLFSNVQSNMTIETLRHRINSDLMGFDIPAAAVCLFQNPIAADPFEFFPLPEKAFLFSAFDTAREFQTCGDEHTLYFNPQKQMLPDGILSGNEMFVVSLFCNTVNYGYIVFRLGSYDITVYAMICKMFSSMLASAFNFTKVESERKKLEKDYELVNHISLTDEMTQLLNRRGIMLLGQKTLEIASAMSQSGMVLFGDIDGLKKINDTFGHSSGDYAIKMEADFLRNSFRSTDIIGRLGGDEFVIIATELNEKKFHFIQQKLNEACSKWNQSANAGFVLSISLGYTFFSPEKKQYVLKYLLEEADASLYKKKKNRKNILPDISVKL
ncbi:MAG: GGDEF domain-containing protein [Treponema sp.]|nr:GGDEF domain-containing protein [Treponema sp.]